MHEITTNAWEIQSVTYTTHQKYRHKSDSRTTTMKHSGEVVIGEIEVVGS